jgi:uncharacterized protein (TIGR03118 family)
MSNIRLYLAAAGLIGASVFGSTTASTSGGHPEPGLAGNGQTETDSGAVVLITDPAADFPNLIDGNGILHGAAIVDPNLVNPWGIAESPASPFWVADNNQGVSTLYAVPGANNTPISVNALVVSIPSPSDRLNPQGTPTGAVFNVDLAGQGFKISGVDKNNNAASAAAIFVFATEDGTIVGWNPGINPPGFDPAKAGTYGIIAVDNSANPNAADGAVYKGLAIATDATTGKTFLYATNFRAGTVEVYDTSFKPVSPFPNAFADPKLKSGYAPFNIVLANGELFVTYAMQDAAKHDDVAGHAHGFVNTFDLSGQMIARFARHGHLNSPWGLAQAPASFGQFAGAIMIGNFGDGHINAFDPGTGEFLGTVVNSKGQEILIDGLWSLRVGNGRAGGDSNTIYFTAGPNGEKDGLFGSLTPVTLGSPCGIPCI